MEELIFRLGDKTVNFAVKPPTVLLPWPVPRRGEHIEVRKASQDQSLTGIVDTVSYYYSSGNNGPVVTVTLVEG